MGEPRPRTRRRVVAVLLLGYTIAIFQHRTLSLALIAVFAVLQRFRIRTPLLYVPVALGLPDHFRRQIEESRLRKRVRTVDLEHDDGQADFH